MKNIQENNKLIAEFMGWKMEDDKYITNHTQWKWLENPLIGEGYDTTNEFLINEILFNCNWSWIMPVVEKIEEIDVVASFAIEQPTIYIWVSSESSTFEDIEVAIFTMSKLEAVYKAVIKFIKWYNKNNKNEENKK